jgi:DNA-binding FrmR family transcriptional regulator
MKHQSTYNRLRRIEGQIRGIEEMISKDRPVEEIFVQLSAVKSSMSSTLSSFIESLFEKGADEKSLSEEQIRLILRSIR